MSHSFELANRAWSAGSTAARPTKTKLKTTMGDNDKKMTTQEGPRRWESLRVDKSARSPAYSGGGTYHSQTYGSKTGERIEKARSPEVLDSDDCSSVGSMVSVSSRATERRKRNWRSRKSDDEECSNSGSGSDAPAAKVVAVKEKRGRGRPPTTGQYVGLAAAKAALVAAEREEMELRAEQELAEATRNRYLTRASVSQLSESSEDLPETQSLASDLNKRVLDSVANIELVATKSKNLKGTYIRVLKDAAADIKMALEDLRKRSSSDETRRLQAANARLQEQVADLRKENVDIRKEMLELQARVAAAVPGAGCSAPSNVDVTEDDSLVQKVMRQVGEYVNARLEALQPRLLPEQRIRPPLAADRRGANHVPEPQPGPSGASVPSSMTQPDPESRKGKKRVGQKNKTVAKGSRPQATVIGGDAPPSIDPPTESWARVVSKGKNRKKVGTAEAPANSQRSRPQTKENQTRRRAKNDGPILRAPKSSAVVLTIQPGGVEKGLTYAKALLAAKAKINLASLGISQLGFRVAVTGARMLEIPGDTSGELADSLAAKLREISDEGDLKVSRPVKCAELRITGLDDSVTPKEVALAIATAGQCASDGIKVGDIRRNVAGLGTAFVRCPVAAAKKVSEGGRLLIGWVSAQVHVLTQKPLRCFRCLEVGHVREQCKAETDRSTLCYRCGLPGHKAGSCSAAPHCAVCAAAGKRAEHRVGSKACSPPRKKKARRGVRSAPTTQSRTTQLPSAEVQGQMDVVT